MEAKNQETFKIVEDRSRLSELSPRDIWEEVTSVDRGELTAASAEDKIHYLGTGNLLTCVGIALYDPNKRVGAVGHESFDFGDKYDLNSHKDKLIQFSGKLAWPVVEGPGDLHSQEKRIVGGVIIPNNITSETHFASYLEALIGIANQKGGKSFQLWLFNMLKPNFRRDSYDDRLKRRIEPHLVTLYSKRLIHSITYRRETGFSMDVKTGELYKTY